MDHGQSDEGADSDDVSPFSVGTLG
jgi:hypothetical protein